MLGFTIPERILIIVGLIAVVLVLLWHEGLFSTEPTNFQTPTTSTTSLPKCSQLPDDFVRRMDRLGVNVCVH